MASVHPSRMGLVPQNAPSRNAQERRGRSPSPRNRYRDRSRSRDGEGRSSDRRDRDGAAENARTAYNRRPSPKYDDYRQAPPHLAAPRPPPPSMYAGRGGGGGGGRGGMNNADWFESRRAQREAMSVDVWPPSPKEPTRSLSPRRKKSSKKHKRDRSVSSDDSSSEEERRRRKEKKRARKERHREENERKKNRHHRSRSPSREHRRHASEAGEDDRHRRKDRSKSRSLRAKSATRSPSRQPPRSPSPTSEKHHNTSLTPSLSRQTSAVPSGDKGRGQEEGSDSDDDVGPKPIMQANASKRFNERDYGGALLRGEGSAMAAFLQDDPSVRIPRRGEIGLTSDQIARYENVGYVMSGSRHKRMNAVRMRKENQVISAEEKRGILKLQKEERERREAILREEFNEIVNEKLKAANVNVDLASTQPPPPS